MLHKEKPDYNRNQYGFYTLDQLVPADHFLRQVEVVIDFDFIYDLVEDTYSSDNGRPSLDPVMLVKIPLIQCFYGIRSMRQTIKDIEVNTAYRWFLGLTLDDKVPHFTTYGKNYSRRFQEKGLIESIFTHILGLCINAGLIDPTEIFIDGTHIKAAANNRKFINQEVEKQAKFMSEQLEIEINQDRVKHGKKPLKPVEKREVKNQKLSTTDPESGWFHKGDHKEVFAYSAQVACDKYGWALAYSVEAGNIHDSQAFPALFAKLEPLKPEYIIADSGYKTPSIAKFLIDKEITPVLPYTRPRGKKGQLRPKDFVYDEHFDCVLCPEHQALTYRTTTREGYREYKSDPAICANCPLLSVCTTSKNHQKVVTRHIWKEYLEQCEDIRHQRGMKELYQHRKETIERLFGTAKEYHNLRYTREKGKSKMEDKIGLTLACLNLKKLAKRMA
ncbi:IS5/IS1182 family transposase [Streptococcus suis]|uniref:IS5/IS1182 family transposase n=2 Tax=Streptococcus suis TaxID=1307 RepID=A0A2I5KQ80_STRSU|nr:IS5/IS1182 family transposase [Streptococcus suis]